MLFMGEEWGATQPFLFFCDFTGELAEAVRKGRREEFSRFPEFADPERVAKIPDPCAESTFLASKLDWSRIDAAHLAYYRELLEDPSRDCPAACCLPFGMEARRSWWVSRLCASLWRAGERRLVLDANLSSNAVAFPKSDVQPFWLLRRRRRFLRALDRALGIDPE